MRSILILGHRGSSGDAPENTLASIALAKDIGAHGVEFDVKLTKDRKVVLLHDPTVDRTSNGKGRLRDIEFKELRKFDFGSWKDNVFRGEKAPLLAEVFDAFGEDLLLNIEITNYSTPKDGLVEEIVKVIRNSGRELNLLFSSFYTQNLILVRKLLPNAMLGQLVLPGVAGWRQRIASRNEVFYAVHPYFTDLGKVFVKRAADKGKKVNVWTVNREEDIREVILAGADGIMTDYPALGLAISKSVNA